jgi:transcriptional regulator with XRE-family HTH domain
MSRKGIKMLKERLKSLRTDRDLTQSELEKISGVAPTTVSKIEIGDRNPSLRTIKKIANGLNVDYKVLLEEERNHSINIHGGNNKNIASSVSENNFNYLLSKQTPFEEAFTEATVDNYEVSFKEAEVSKILKNISQNGIIRLEEALETIHKLFELKQFQKTHGIL